MIKKLFVKFDPGPKSKIRNFQKIEIKKNGGSFYKLFHIENIDTKSSHFGPELSLKFYFENSSKTPKNGRVQKTSEHKSTEIESNISPNLT